MICERLQVPVYKVEPRFESLLLRLYVIVEILRKEMAPSEGGMEVLYDLFIRTLGQVMHVFN